MRVLKFGGTSMVDEQSWCRVLNIITCYKNPVVVVSATARTTRQLVAAAELAQTDLTEAKKIGREIGERHKELTINFLEHSNVIQKTELEQNCIRWIDKCINDLNDVLRQIAVNNEVSAKQKDTVSSLGEQLSAYLFAQCGQAYGLATEWVDARTVIKTDSNFGRAQPNVDKIKESVSVLNQISIQNRIPVIGGFYGENEQGTITTLGFEGSDYTTSLLGAALTAEAIEIWTDVSGIYTCDPRVISSAKPVEKLSFRDAAELAKHGAKVLHPSTMEPASSVEIPVIVKNIFIPDHPGTKIDASAAENSICKAIAFIEQATLLKLNTANRNIRDHQLVEIFALLEEHKPSIIAIDTDGDHTSVVLKKSSLAEKLQAELSAIGAVSNYENRGVIGLIGCRNTNETDLKERITSTLSTNPLLLIFKEQKKVLNIIMDEEELLYSVKKLHKYLFEQALGIER